MDLFAVWVRDVLEEHKVYERLTKREQEVLSWVALGKTNAEIATILSLAPSTVRKHLENVYVKLSVRTRTAAVARFIGLVEPCRGGLRDGSDGTRTRDLRRDRPAF
jgi:DNA-binding CsgD family transcriptional regulator